MAPGVYRFRDSRGRILYLGRATQLRRRVASYWGPLRGRRHLARMVGQIVRVEAVECDSPHEAAWLERSLMQRSKPRWNRSVGGQEVPVRLRLDLSARTPGLSLVHEAIAAPHIEHFGPYLGGTQLRVALRALHRLHPLALAGSTPSGSVRDMARLRAVSSDDRDLLADRIIAVLQRDPSAVDAALAELADFRDAASERLDFERAALLQAELEALGWLVAPQRVMVADGGDHTFTGWADGYAVDFRMTAGAVDGWTIRGCTFAAAADRITATPAGWRPYVDRAAQLAARLTSAAGQG